MLRIFHSDNVEKYHARPVNTSAIVGRSAGRRRKAPGRTAKKEIVRSVDNIYYSWIQVVSATFAELKKE
uniref:hypothetical protein n=1 Tax=Candidatus Electronema sp. TaxID=2698783 RepID=UPI0040565F1F